MQGIGRWEDGGREYRRFSVGRGMGGVCAVGKRDSEKAECVQCLWEIVSTSGSY